MRAYVTIVDGEMDLLPYYLRYYKTYGGVTEVFLCVFGTEEDQRVASCYVLDAELELTCGAVFPAESFLAKRRVDYYRSVHPEGQWAYFTDLDEFPSHEAFAAVARRERPYVAGRWLDRIAQDGKPAAVRHGEPLDEQYPLCCRARPMMRLGTQCGYIAAPFAGYSHHPSACRRGRRAWKSATKYDLHHFKWQANVVSRLRNRARRVTAAGIRRQPSHVRRQLEFLKRGFDASKLQQAPRLGC